MKPCHHKGALKSAKEKLIASNFNDLFTNTRISTRTVHFPLQVLSFIAQETKYKRKAARFSLGENNFLPTTASAVYLARLKKNKYNSVQMKKKNIFFSLGTTVHVSGHIFGSLELMIYSTVWQPNVEVRICNNSLSNNPSLPLFQSRTFRNNTLFLPELTAEHCIHLHAHAIKHNFHKDRLLSTAEEKKMKGKNHYKMLPLLWLRLHNEMNKVTAKKEPRDVRAIFQNPWWHSSGNYLIALYKKNFKSSKCWQSSAHACFRQIAIKQSVQWTMVCTTDPC